MWFTTNGMCVKNKTIIYEARASNSKRDCEHDLYCCLLPQCEALCTCCSGFPIATVIILLPPDWESELQKITNESVHTGARNVHDYLLATDSVLLLPIYTWTWKSVAVLFNLWDGTHWCRGENPAVRMTHTLLVRIAKEVFLALKSKALEALSIACSMFFQLKHSYVQHEPLWLFTHHRVAWSQPFNNLRPLCFSAFVWDQPYDHSLWLQFACFLELVL